MYDAKLLTVERLQGIVERVTFHNPENGFCVLRVKVDGHRSLVTIIGNSANIAAGEHIECSGEWHQDKTYGRQFKATQHLKSILPNSIEGMEQYLASGIVKGIGVKTAKILMNEFGEETFNVIENEPQRLLALTSLGMKRKKQILSSWSEQKSVRDIMIFMQGHGMSTARAMRIYKTYGDNAIQKVTENPYRLALDIQNIGFKIADDLALSLGLTRDSIERARAGVHHVLQEHCRNGHCAEAYQKLVTSCMSLLEISEEIIEQAIEKEIAGNKLILENIDDVPCIFPVALHRAESESAMHLLRLGSGQPPWGHIDTQEIIPWVEKQTGLQLATSQKHAIDVVLKHKLSIITGGPGVGKTTIVNSILKVIQAKRLAIALCAPTGRAAKRLTETTHLKAKTIHRLLGFNPETRSFKHHRDNPLPIDLLVVDEASMIDTVLLHSLLDAIPDQAALIFVGDVDQLPSVGAGAILLDMIRSEVIPTVRLTEIFRQAVDSKIIENAHRINQGELPLPNVALQSDFYTMYAETPEEIHKQLMELISERLPAYLECNNMTDIQVLTPMNRGDLGSVALNNILQKELNGDSEPKIARYGYTFSPGDKVIQTLNNYEKDVFNGDIGFVTQVNLQDSVVKVSFDQRIVEYEFSELDELSLAYAISVHKSQGSEFPVVVMLLSTQHYMLLARNLLYTGVTRGKRMVVLIAQKKAVAMAVKNNREQLRLTKLAERLNNSLLSKI